MNTTNQKPENQHLIVTLALLQGFEFTRHGFRLKKDENDDVDGFSDGEQKVYDDHDYEAVIPDDLNSLIALEKHYQISIEVIRKSQSFHLMGYTDQNGEFVKMTATPNKYLVRLMQNTLYSILKDKVQKELTQTLIDCPHVDDLDERVLKGTNE